MAGIEFLSFKQIEEQYPGCVKSDTLYQWHAHKRHGFHQIVTKIGRNARVRRDQWEAFLAAGLNAEDQQAA